MYLMSFNLKVLGSKLNFLVQKMLNLNGIFNFRKKMFVLECLSKKAVWPSGRLAEIKPLFKYNIYIIIS